MKSIVFMTSLFFLPEASAAGLLVSEGQVIELSERSAHKLDAFIAEKERVAFDAQSKEDKYSPRLFTNLGYSKSNQKPFIQFAPVTSPTAHIETGVRKQMPHGVSGQVSLFSDQLSLPDGSVTRTTHSGARLQLDVDLWRNFLGRLDQLERDEFRGKKHVAELRSQMNKQQFEMHLRQIYWSLVANHEIKKLTQAMLGVVTKQRDNAKRRMQDSVGTMADLARREAQVATYEGRLVNLTYQQEQLWKTLKAELPDLHGNDLELAPYDIIAASQVVNACKQKISSYAQIPAEFTTYDELSRAIEAEIEASIAANQSRSDLDLSFFATTEYSAREDGFQGSFEEIGEEPTFMYQAGLALSMPLGAQVSSTQKIKQNRLQRLKKSQLSEIKTMLASTHAQTKKYFQLLDEVQESSLRTKKYLSEAVEESQKMYQQARIPIDTLINDQNALLESQINTVNVQLKVVTEILNYLKIFPQLPCDFNHNVKG